MFSFLPLSTFSLGFHHRHAPGQSQQLLQPLDLHALHRPPLPRTCAALPLLLIPPPERQPAWGDERQQEEQLDHLCPEPAQLQPEAVLTAIPGVTGPGLPSTSGAARQRRSGSWRLGTCVYEVPFGLYPLYLGQLELGGEAAPMGKDCRVTQPSSQAPGLP